MELTAARAGKRTVRGALACRRTRLRAAGAECVAKWLLGRV